MVWQGKPITPDLRLAPNFTFGELTHTTHRELIEDNRRIAAEFIGALAETAQLIQQVRDRWGALRVLSGFRSGQLNAAVQGNIRSQHCKAQAVDFRLVDHKSRPLREVFDWIRLESGLSYGQVILEGRANDHGYTGPFGWIHLSLGSPWRDPSRCYQALTWTAADGFKRVVSSGGST